MIATATDTEGFDALQCNGCGAALQVRAGERTTRCPYCASPAVVARSRTGAPEPAFVAGFVVTEQTARDKARAWIRATWFARGKFSQSDISEIRGVYLPVYLYSAAAHVQYTASIGENYTVVETYTTTDAKGNTVTQTRTRVETEWRSLQGQWAAYVDDIIVTASRGLPNAELEAVEPFDTRALRRYTTKLLSGWIAEDPSMSAEECRRLAHQEAVDAVGRRLGAHMPGDSYRDLKYSTSIAHEDLTLVLVPVWILAVRYDEAEPPVRMLINGQTGKLSGRPPRSWRKIVAAVVGAGAAAALLYLVLRMVMT